MVTTLEATHLVYASLKLILPSNDKKGLINKFMALINILNIPIRKYYLFSHTALSIVKSLFADEHNDL